MSIIKRKAGSEDIVKSVLEFDAVPTEGSPNLVDSGTVAQAIGENSNVALFKFTGTDYPLNADMNDEFIKGKTVVLMHNPGGTQYDFYYLVQRASGSGHVTMYFKGRYNSIKVADDTWTFYNDSVNAVAIAPLYDSTSTYPTVGTAVMYSGKRYVNNVAINSSEDWDPSHWTEKSLEDEIGNVEALLAAL